MSYLISLSAGGQSLKKSIGSHKGKAYHIHHLSAIRLSWKLVRNWYSHYPDSGWCSSVLHGIGNSALNINDAQRTMTFPRLRKHTNYLALSYFGNVVNAIILFTSIKITGSLPHSCDGQGGIGAKRQYAELLVSGQSCVCSRESV